MITIIWIGILVASLFVLIKASDKFTESAEKLGLMLGLAPFIIGVTIVSIGTSLPELVSGIIATVKGSSEIVVANVIGSNNANIFLVIGIALLLSKRIVKIKHNLLRVDLPLLVCSAFFLSVIVWDGIVTLPEGILLLLGFIAYLEYVMHTRKKHEKLVDMNGITLYQKIKPNIKIGLTLIISAALVYLGAHFTIEAVIKLSSLLSIGTEIIALSAVALGTSLPELSVSVAAMRKGKAEIAVGNVLGSNIFNSFAVVGISSLFGKLIVPQTIISFALPMMIIATILFFFMTQDREISRWEGWVLLLFYIFFIGKIFSLF